MIFRVNNPSVDGAWVFGRGRTVVANSSKPLLDQKRRRTPLQRTGVCGSKRSHQPLLVTWRRYRLLAENRQLEIARAQVTPDTARYTCIAMSEAGVADRDFDLDVLGETSGLLDFRSAGLPVFRGNWHRLTCHEDVKRSLCDRNCRGHVFHVHF